MFTCLLFSSFSLSLCNGFLMQRDRESVGLGEVRDGAYLVVVECRRTTGGVTSSPSLLPPEREKRRRLWNFIPVIDMYNLVMHCHLTGL